MLITCYFAAKVAVLKLDGNNELCKVDEVGELCISSKTVGNGFWGLVGKTKQVFNVSSYHFIIAVSLLFVSSTAFFMGFALRSLVASCPGL